MHFSREYNPLSYALSYREALRSFPRKGVEKPPGRFPVGEGLGKGIIVRD